MQQRNTERLARRKQNTRKTILIMVVLLMAFGMIYYQFVQTIQLIHRDRVNSDTAVNAERVVVMPANGDSVNLYDGR